MSVRSRARLEARTVLGPETVAMHFAIASGPMRFVGGQYVIVETGVIQGDKPIKRAFSIASSDRDHQRFTLVVRRHGPGSAAMLERAIGDEISFSGPWGKCVATESETATSLVVATSIGITCAIGLFRSERFRRRRMVPMLEVLVRVGEQPVLAADAIRALLDTSDASIRFGVFDEHDRRSVDSFVRRRIDAGVDELFFVGDGRANASFATHATRIGFDESRIFVEHFFDKPQARSSEAT